MTQKINTMLLAAIPGCLIILIFRPSPSVGRFQPLPNSTLGVVIDTQTGQWCMPYRSPAVDEMPLCKDLE